MRHLLMLGVVVLLAVTAGGIKAVDPEPAEAHSGHPILAVLFHPAAVLACGWHSNCDGNFGDNPSMGLDWNPCQGCSTTVRLRLMIVLGNGMEALGHTQSESVLGCPKARVTYVKRLADSAVFGKVIQLHTQAPSTYYSNFMTGNNEPVTGAMVPLGQDPCASWVHVMQWYESGDYDAGWTQNVNGWPTEAQCFHCDTTYAPWATYEYNFVFTS